MNIRLTPGDPRPIYVQIVDEVRRAVVMGVLEPDDPLPSVRRLAGELRVNPNTVQQAYRELERESVVYVKRGQGTFVSNRDTAATERPGLVRDVAERAIRDAFRHGVTSDELIEAIRRHSAADPATEPPGDHSTEGDEA